MVARACAPPAGSWLVFWRSLSGRLRRLLHRILQWRKMGLHTCDIASVDVVALRPSWRCVDGAISHRYEAEVKTTFTLQEVWLDVAGLGHLPKHLVLSGGWHEALPFWEVCLTCLCPLSLEDQSGRKLVFCVSGDSYGQLACCYGWAREWLRHVFDRMFWSLAVLTAWVSRPFGGSAYSCAAVLKVCCCCLPPWQPWVWLFAEHGV